MIDVLELASKDYWKLLKKTPRKENAVEVVAKSVGLFSTCFMITRLFKKRGSSEDFKYNLAKAKKNGNIDTIIYSFPFRLGITGLKSFVPSPRHVRRATAEIVLHFKNFCKPEKTFSGFRSDIFSCVKAVAFLSLKSTELQGLRVDIWVDSCEIGGVEFTRLAFRLLDVDISVQSTSSVFCFAGKPILFWKISLMFIGLGIAYMLYKVNMVNFICS